MVHHCTIRPASYKGYGCNNAKPPRPPHCNTIIDIVVLGCGPIPTGDGATALFNGVHILGEIQPAGGFDTLAELQWKDQIGPSIPVQNYQPYHNQPSGASLCSVNWPWDRTGTLFVATKIRGNIRCLGGMEGMANW